MYPGDSQCGQLAEFARCRLNQRQHCDWPAMVCDGDQDVCLLDIGQDGMERRALASVLVTCRLRLWHNCALLKLVDQAPLRPGGCASAGFLRRSQRRNASRQGDSTRA